MLPYLYSTGYETTREGIPMMRAMVLEYPEDMNVRNISTEYMLGGSVLVAPVFDQQKHYVYLPEGSWVDLETKERICGNKWINYPQQIDVIPMFLRENTMMATLKDVPEHIADENFHGLELVMNITDSIEQDYFDDGVEGKFTAVLRDGVLAITLKDIPAESFRIYAGSEIREVTVNGEVRNVTKCDRAFVV